MNLKPITFAALLAAPVFGATAQAPQASDQSDGHRGWLLKAAGALTSAAVFSSMIHSDAPGASTFGQTQGDLHRVDLNGPENNNPVIGGDDDVVTTTPEPGTAALLATGLVGLAGMVRRRPRVS